MCRKRLSKFDGIEYFAGQVITEMEEYSLG
jgi:hypothetical protein